MLPKSAMSVAIPKAHLLCRFTLAHQNIQASEHGSSAPLRLGNCRMDLFSVTTTLDEIADFCLIQWAASQDSDSQQRRCQGRSFTMPNFAANSQTFISSRNHCFRTRRRARVASKTVTVDQLPFYSFHGKQMLFCKTSKINSLPPIW